MLALSGIGVVLIQSAAPAYAGRQLAGICAGTVLMALLSVVDYKRLMNQGWFWYLAGMAFLLAVNAVGAVSGGAARWLELGSFRFQPSELGKILFILFFADWFQAHRNELGQWKYLLASFLLMALPVFSILGQPDLSTAIVLSFIFACMLFAAGMDYRKIGKILAIVFPAGAVFLFLITRPGQTLLNDYQYRRIMAWLFPSVWAEEAYQQRNSIMATGMGELTGNGILTESPETVINSGFLPEAHTDFIMAVAGERLGFAGCALMIELLFLITMGCIRIGMRAGNLSGRLVCAGMAALVGGQSFVNLGVVSGLLPNTGLTLPFVSYGLTSLVSLYMGMGVVMNVGAEERKTFQKQYR